MPTLNTEFEKQPATVETLQAEIDELQLRLQEAEETISAIRSGAVDALVVEESTGHRIYTLEGADRPYRLFVEEMQQGAATLHADGTIAWCNRQLADLLKTPQEKLVGAALQDFVSPDSRAVYDNLLWQGKTHSGRGAVDLRRTGGGLVSAYLTFNALPKDCGAAIGVLFTDQTPQKHHEQLTAAHIALRESERRFREMIDALPVAIYTTDAEGRLTHFNPAAVEFSGHRPQLGTDQWCVSFKLYHPDGRPMPHGECPMAIALKEGRVIRGAEAIAERPDGTRVWFTPYPTPLRDRMGNIVGGINMLLDITERKQAESRLRANEERFRTLFELGPVAVYSCDKAGVIQDFNLRAAELWGRAPAPGDTDERFCGSFRLYRPDGTLMPHEQCPMADVLCGRIPAMHDAEVIIERPGGSRIIVIVNIRPLKDEAGEITGAINCFYDVTERKQAEEALRESEERFRLMADAVPVLIWVSDTTKGCTWFNQYWKDFSGRPMEELLGDGWARDVHPDDLDRCMNVYVTHFDARQPFSMEYRMKRRDGEYRWVSDSGIPRFEANGTFTGYIGACVDFTERKQAEEARARLAAIVESSDDAIISKDLNGIISSWNRGAELLFGYTAQEAFGHPVTMLIPPDHLSEEPGILERIRRGEAIQHYETVRRRKDGTLFDISLTVSPIRNSDGQITGASKVGRDITERRQAEEALRAAQAKLQEHARELEMRIAERTIDLQATNKQLEAFVYSIAHDLRAPLRSMQGFSEMLAKEAGSALSEAGRDFAQRISRSAQFMDTLLLELLAFSRTAQQGIELTSVNLETVTQSVLSRLEKEIQERKARVELVGPWPAAIGHEPTLGQVIFNLVDNALKFVAAGVAPVVRVRVQEWAVVAASSPRDGSEEVSGSWVRVWVEDNGIGVAPEHQEQIFRLFTRLHGDTYGGTGVGLAIVQKGIERMGGRVGVESSPGQGSRFWFELRKG